MARQSVWFCEDVHKPYRSGFGRSKVEAEAWVTGNNGFDRYTGARIADAIAAGKACEARLILVPVAVAKVLLKICRRD